MRSSLATSHCFTLLVFASVSACVRACVRALQYYTAEWEPAFLRQAREFPFFPLLPREARGWIAVSRSRHAGPGPGTMTVTTQARATTSATVMRLERERERERALLGTISITGWSRAAARPADRRHGCLARGPMWALYGRFTTVTLSSAVTRA